MIEDARTFVFIGGSGDGERREVPCNDRGEPKYPHHTLGFADAEETSIADPVFHTEHYHAEMYQAGSLLAFVFVHEDLSQEEALAKLIAGYKSGPQRRI